MKVPAFCRKRRLAVTVAGLAVILCICLFGVALASSGEHGEVGEQAVESSHMAKTDWYKVLNFVILAGGLVFLLKKPVSSALNDRIKSIRDQLDDLETKKKDAEAELAEYNKKLATLETEADRIIADYIKQGEEAKARILAAAETSAKKLEEQAKKNIAHEFQAAKAQLKEDVLEKAMAKAEALIQAKVTEEDQARLVDDYLSKVVAE